MKGLLILLARGLHAGYDDAAAFTDAVCKNSSAIAQVLARTEPGLDECLSKGELYFAQPLSVCREPCQAKVVAACRRVVEECPDLAKAKALDAFSKVGTYLLWSNSANVDVVCRSLGGRNSTCLEDLVRASADIQNEKAKPKTSSYANHDLTPDQLARVCSPCTRDIYEAFQGKEDQLPGLYLREIPEPGEVLDGVGEICGLKIAPREDTAKKQPVYDEQTPPSSTGQTNQEPVYDEQPPLPSAGQTNQQPAYKEQPPKEPAQPAASTGRSEPPVAQPIYEEQPPKEPTQPEASTKQSEPPVAQPIDEEQPPPSSAGQTSPQPKYNTQAPQEPPSSAGQTNQQPEKVAAPPAYDQPFYPSTSEPSSAGGTTPAYPPEQPSSGNANPSAPYAIVLAGRSVPGSSPPGFGAPGYGHPRGHPRGHGGGYGGGYNRGHGGGYGGGHGRGHGGGYGGHRGPGHHGPYMHRR